MNGLILLLLLVALATPGESSTYTCDSRNPCILKDVILESESDIDSAVFPNIKDPLIITSGNIPNFSRKLAEKLITITDLTVNGLQCETFFIRPEMIHVEANNNRIHKILVDSDEKQTYKLMSLNLTSNKLTDVSVLQRFTQLRVLNINVNSLDRLSMNTFSGMKELRHLSLANNQLETIETDETFQLLKLRYLSLAGNKISELNIEKWELPSLEDLDLSRNNLYVMSGGLNQFGNLKKVKLSRNWWKCELLSDIIHATKAQLDSDPSDRCSKENMPSKQGICCHHDATNYLSASDDLGLFSDKWKELRELQQTVHLLNDAFTKNNEQIANEKASKTASIEERLGVIEKEQKKLSERLEEKDSRVAIDETAELRDVAADHKHSITTLEEKQSQLSSDLETLVERLNKIYERIDRNSANMESVTGKIAALEKAELERSTPSEPPASSLSKLEKSIQQLESQQLKYHLSSIDLKRQIDEERKRNNEFQTHLNSLKKENEILRNEVLIARDNIRIAFKILDEISLIEE
ncbi:leucine-rich repeats and immunoglobulin-like domains protein 1 [Wyeomyia smithii]|uniref:leucine-rich repeats and immunoglobulin-like domains protein 1 n=1 Tax=Wyeomyia smithii TaxID=174621 RepID=UPI0024680597|nr:leucine-rich repeats and immunoglobulin-like domains protein 1 [Wyeomyia smithii]